MGRASRLKKSRQSGPDPNTPLAERIKTEPRWAQTEVIRAPAGSVKMSRLLMDFCRPHLAPGARAADCQETLALAVMAWNLGALDPLTRAERLALVQNDLTPEHRHLLQQLIARKLTHYPDVNRLVVEFQLRDSPEGLHLSVGTVAQTDPGKAPTLNCHPTNVPSPLRACLT